MTHLHFHKLNLINELFVNYPRTLNRKIMKIGNRKIFTLLLVEPSCTKYFEAEFTNYLLCNAGILFLIQNNLGILLTTISVFLECVIYELWFRLFEIKIFV